MRRLRPKGRERGASIVELALIAPVMVLLVFGVLDLSRAYQMQIRLENAAREGAAYAQSYPDRIQGCPGDVDVWTRVEEEEPGVSGSPEFTVAVTGERADGTAAALVNCDGDEVKPGDRVRVDVSARYDIATPFVAAVTGGSLRLTGSAQVRVQGQVRS